MRRRSPDTTRGSAGSDVHHLARAASAVALAAAVAASCTTRRIGDPTEQWVLEGMPERLAPVISPEVMAERAERLGRAPSIRWIGTIPADSSTLPILSPDGMVIAVQRPPAVAWRDLLGWSREMPSPPPAIGIHRRSIDADAGVFDEGRTLPEPLILGRSSDGRGFVVESPRPDGARWIGLARWEDGGIEWLVADDAVNAFGAIAEDGSMAWCRSEVPGEPMSLRLRRPDGSMREWPSAFGRCWMTPVFSGDGQTLYALLQGDGRADLVAIDLSDPSREPRSVEYSLRVDPRRSLRSVAALGDAASPLGEDGWWLLHPEWGTLARWRPEATSLERLPPGIYAVARPVGGGALILDREGLWLAKPAKTEAGAAAAEELNLIIEGGWLPRRRGGDPDAAILLGPREDGFDVMELTLRPRG